MFHYVIAVNTCPYLFRCLCTVISRAGGFGSTNSNRFGQQTDSIHHIVNLDTLQCGEWGLPPEKIIKYQTPVGLS